MIAAGYGAAVDMLRSASRDTYRGPATPVPTLIDALRTTGGLRPDDLVTHTRTAAGPAAGAWLGPLIQALLRLLAEVALGELLRRLVDRAQDWWDDRDAARDLEDSAEDAGNALKDIEDVADTALTEITDALTAVITQLCAFLSRIDPATHPGMFQECVGAGSELIDSAGDALLQTCTDRDEAVAGCLDEFLTRCEAVCEQPVAAPQDDVADCDGPPAAPVPAPENPVPPVAPGVPVSPVAPVAPAFSGEAVTALQSSGAPTPAPAPPSSTNEPTPAVSAAQEQPTTPQATAPAVPGAPADGPPPTAPTAPVSETAPDGDVPESLPTSPQTVTPEPVDEDTPAAGNCANVLGAAGLGVAALGLALIISLLEECLPELAAADIIPGGLPEPAEAAEPLIEPAAGPGIEPETESVLAEVPEPTPPPKQTVPEPPASPVDLTDVPEPPPPPKQQIPTPPADMPAPTSDNPPAPAPVPGGARKAGEW